MTIKTAAPASTVLSIDPIETNTLAIGVRGTSPLIINRLSEKAKHELLLPRGRKTTAERASTLKHNPLEEFRASSYTIANDDAPTKLAVMSASFKRAMMTAALDLPGAKKTQIGRLVHVEGHLTPIFGIPEIFSAITRSADINRTPDVRTRCIVPEWAALVHVRFVVPLLTERVVLNLMAAAGQIAGIGDWRLEKGSGSFGAFEVTDPETDIVFARILETGGRRAQTEAMMSPNAYDDETQELLAWFDTEVKARGR